MVPDDVLLAHSVVQEIDHMLTRDEEIKECD
jgi:hypothetical protein